MCPTCDRRVGLDRAKRPDSGGPPSCHEASIAAMAPPPFRSERPPVGTDVRTSCGRDDGASWTVTSCRPGVDGLPRPLWDARSPHRSAHTDACRPLRWRVPRPPGDRTRRNRGPGPAGSHRARPGARRRRVVLAGGVESMSQVEHYAPGLRCTGRRCAARPSRPRQGDGRRRTSSRRRRHDRNCGEPPAAVRDQ